MRFALAQFLVLKLNIAFSVVLGIVVGTFICDNAQFMKLLPWIPINRVFELMLMRLLESQLANVFAVTYTPNASELILITPPLLIVLLVKEML